MGQADWVSVLGALPQTEKIIGVLRPGIEILDVVIHRVADAIFSKAENVEAVGELVFLGIIHGIVNSNVNAIEHEGEKVESTPIRTRKRQLSLSTSVHQHFSKEMTYNAKTFLHLLRMRISKCFDLVSDWIVTKVLVATYVVVVKAEN